jgi:hypothetical protein
MRHGSSFLCFQDSTCLAASRRHGTFELEFTRKATVSALVARTNSNYYYTLLVERAMASTRGRSGDCSLEKEGWTESWIVFCAILVVSRVPKLSAVGEVAWEFVDISASWPSKVL